MDFVVAGPGVWRGGYNSGKIDSTNTYFGELNAARDQRMIQLAVKLYF